MLRFTPFALITALALPVSAQSPADRIAQIRDATTLDAPGQKPFHIRIDFEIPALKDSPASTGSIEEWWVPGFAPYQVVTTAKGAEIWPTAAGMDYPALTRESGLAHLLLDEAIHPFTDKFEPDWKFKQTDERFGNITLTCISGTRPGGSSASQKYCVSQGTDDLRLKSEPGIYAILRNSVATFCDQSVARDLKIVYGHDDVIHGKVTILAPIELSELPRFPGASAPLPLPTQPAAPKRISGEYPTLAGSGTVFFVFDFLIDESGKVSSLSILYCSDPKHADLVAAFIAKWKYKPAIADGKPVKSFSSGTVTIRRD